MARFCEVDIFTYCIMTNHFHLLVRVPQKQKVSDKELVAGFAQLYGKQKGKVETLEETLPFLRFGIHSQVSIVRPMLRLNLVPKF